MHYMELVMRKIILQEKDYGDIVRLYESGKTLKHIGNRYNVSWGTVKNLLGRLNIHMRRKGSIPISGRLNLDTDFFKTVNTESKAYWLGVVCADGHIARSSRDCLFYNKMALISKDLDLIDKFKRSINSGHKISKRCIYDKRTKKYYTSYMIQITSKWFVSHLINLGIGHDKTTKAKFPNIDTTLYRHFIRGLFDGDGSLSLSNNRLRINLISTKEILIFIQNHLYTTFNIRPLEITSISQTKNVYKMYLYSKAPTFLKYLYNDCKFYLDRKLNRFIKYKELGIIR